MNDKIRGIYEVLIDGAQRGLTNDQLFQYVLDHCSKATSKKIVKASLLALSDPELRDRNILDVVYALAIKHRLDPLSKDDIEDLKGKSEPDPKRKPDQKRFSEETDVGQVIP